MKYFEYQLSTKRGVLSTGSRIVVWTHQLPTRQKYVSFLKAGDVLARLPNPIYGFRVKKILKNEL